MQAQSDVKAALDHYHKRAYDAPLKAPLKAGKISSRNREPETTSGSCWTGWRVSRCFLLLASMSAHQAAGARCSMHVAYFADEAKWKAAAEDHRHNLTCGAFNPVHASDGRTLPVDARFGLAILSTNERLDNRDHWYSALVVAEFVVKRANGSIVPSFVRISMASLEPTMHGSPDSFLPVLWVWQALHVFDAVEFQRYQSPRDPVGLADILPNCRHAYDCLARFTTPELISSKALYRLPDDVETDAAGDGFERWQHGVQDWVKTDPGFGGYTPFKSLDEVLANAVLLKQATKPVDPRRMIRDGDVVAFFIKLQPKFDLDAPKLGTAGRQVMETAWRLLKHLPSRTVAAGFYSTQVRGETARTTVYGPHAVRATSASFRNWFCLPWRSGFHRFLFRWIRERCFPSRTVFSVRSIPPTHPDVVDLKADIPRRRDLFVKAVFNSPRAMVAAPIARALAHRRRVGFFF
jgi:hypothetical protein